MHLFIFGYSIPFTISFLIFFFFKLINSSFVLIVCVWITDDVKKLQLKQKKYTSEAEEAFLRHARYVLWYECLKFRNLLYKIIKNLDYVQVGFENLMYSYIDIT